MEAAALVADEYTIRPLTADDPVAGQEVARKAFADLAARLAMDPWPGPEPEESRLRGEARIRHIIETDPEGSVGAFAGDELVGVGLAIRRGDLWGLSLLVVDPAHQSRTVGRSLLRRTLEYAEGCAGRIILSSSDSRALRAYTTAGFELHPSVNAPGVPDRRRIPAGLGVTECDPDLDLVDAVDRVVRGASHRVDIPTLMGAGGRFLAVRDAADHGYAISDPTGVKLLAATTPAVAQRLLWEVLAGSDGSTRMMVANLDARQQWAIEVVLAAGLSLMPYVGGLLVHGEMGPLTPYIPSGAYL